MLNKVNPIQAGNFEGSAGPGGGGFKAPSVFQDWQMLCTWNFAGTYLNMFGAIWHKNMFCWRHHFLMTSSEILSTVTFLYILKYQILLVVIRFKNLIKPGNLFQTWFTLKTMTMTSSDLPSDDVIGD